MSLKRSYNNYNEPTETSDSKQSDDHDIFESSTIEDRSSSFLAIFSPTLEPKALQAHPPYKKASHRILAWRKLSKQQVLAATSSSVKTLYDIGSDEDGEKYAGKKLEKLLIEMNVTGAVVVARWYGGVLLGPVRFDHIVNVAREAIKKWQSATTGSSPEKRIKVDPSIHLTPEQEADQKQRLAKQLADRDNSIKVLRELLAEKKASKSEKELTQELPKSTTEGQAKSVAGPDYVSMPLPKLRQLEKARDTTISWILRQIDQIEAESGKTSNDQPG